MRIDDPSGLGRAQRSSRTLLPIGALVLLVALGLLAALSGNAHAAPATKLAITSVNGGVSPNAGTPGFSVLIQSQSNNGNAANVSAATGVSLSLKTGTGTLGGTLTGTIAAGTNGVTLSAVTYTKAESGVSLTVTRTSGDNLSAGSSTTFTVNPGNVTTLAFTTQPGAATAGSAIPGPPAVTVRDANGNTATSSAAAVTVAIGTNPGGGTLSGTTTVNAVSGVATFSNLSVNKTGAGYTLAASAAGLTSATSSTFAVSAASATKLAFGQAPTNTAAGGAIAPAVTVLVQDQFGNTTTGAASVTLAIATNPGSGTLSGTTTVSAVNGVATFSNLSINRTGIGYTLAASATGLSGATSTGFTISAGSAAVLVFGQQPSTTTAGQTITPAITVQIQDQFANLTASTASVSLGIGANPSGGILGGTTTVNAVAGVATFSNLSLDKAGTGYTVTASASGLAGATSGSFTITAPPVSRVAFGQSPTTTVAGQPVMPAVRVLLQDANGNTVTTSTAGVTLAIGTNPGGGTLSGTTTVNAVNGVATFGGLSIDQPGSAYTLVASSAGVTSATSGSFTITAQGAQISYIYDALGRLRAVVDPATNEVAIYSYDGVGNLLSVGRQSADIVTVLEVMPANGLPGSTVRISGTAFGTGGSSNTVTFNGTTANVVSASRTQIVATVPAGATTGSIVVASPGGIATSEAVFSVGGLTLTGFSPAIGVAGSSVTLTGTNFSTLANDRVVFNSNVRRGSVTAASPTQLTVTVPSNVGSGPIAVSTPLGRVVSTQDFFITPTPYTSASVDVTGRMAIGDDRTVTITTAGHIGLFAFDAVAGQYVSLGVLGTLGATVSILNQDGSTMQSTRPPGDMNALLTKSGTYAILVAADSTATGSLTLSLTPPISDTISTSDPPVAVTLRPGQVVRKAFFGTAGEWVTFAVSDISSALSNNCYPWDTPIFVSIVKPDGSDLVSTWTNQCGGHASAQLPTTRMYTAFVDVIQARAGTLTVTLSDAVSGTIATTDAPLAVTLRPGQEIRKPFAGTAGEWVSFAVSNISSTLANNCYGWDTPILVSILKPDGSQLVSTWTNQCGNQVVAQLPTTGTYTGYVGVAQARAGTLTVTLSDAVAGTIATTDAPLAVTLRPGQEIRKPFAGTAGEWVSFAVSNISSTLANNCYGWDTPIFVSILKPDGSQLVSTWTNQCGNQVVAQLPTTGTYTAYVGVVQARAGTLTVKLSDQ